MAIIRTQKEANSVIEFELPMGTASIHVIQNHDTSKNLNSASPFKICAVSLLNSSGKKMY